MSRTLRADDALLHAASVPVDSDLWTVVDVCMTDSHLLENPGLRPHEARRWAHESGGGRTRARGSRQRPAGMTTGLNTRTQDAGWSVAAH